MQYFEDCGKIQQSNSECEMVDNTVNDESKNISKVSSFHSAGSSQIFLLINSFVIKTLVVKF